MANGYDYIEVFQLWVCSALQGCKRPHCIGNLMKGTKQNETRKLPYINTFALIGGSISEDKNTAPWQYIDFEQKELRNPRLVLV